LYVVSEKDRSNSGVLGSHIDLGDLFGLVTAPGTDFFVVKTSFWLPIR
jgi:hypothetical protein